MKQIQNKQLPRRWKEEILTEITEKVADRNHVTPKYVGAGVPLISPRDFLEGNEIDFNTKKFISEEDYREDYKKVDFKEKDLLLSRIGTIGKVRILTENKKFMALHSIVQIRPNIQKIIPSFLYYSLQSFDVQNQIKKGIKSIGTPDLGIDKIRNFIISYPESKEEQTLIVQEIEKQFTRLDASVKALKSVKKKLEVYRKAILYSTFNEISQKRNLDQICEKVTQGPNPKLKDYSGTEGNYVLKTKDFYNYRVLYDKCDLTGKELIKEWERFILKEGDVILALVGVGSIGKVNVFREQPNKKFIFTRATGLIRPKKEEADPQYLHYFFLSPQGSKMIEKGIGGSTGQLVIKTSYLKELEILAPSIREQIKIVQSIESKFSIIDKIEQVIEESLNKALKLRKSILKSAFEGKLVKIKEVQND